MDCKRFGKWFRGCHFEGRYDLAEYRGKLGRVEVTGEPLSNVIEATKARTYVHDICTTCGKRVGRDAPAPAATPDNNPEQSLADETRGIHDT